MPPEDRVERGRAGRDHVAGLRVQLSVGQPHRAGLVVVGIEPPGEVVDQVVDILERPEVMVIGRAAAEGEEIAEVQNPLDVLGVRIALEDQGRVAPWPAEAVPERVDSKGGLEDPVDVDEVRDVGDPRLAEQATAGVELLTRNALELGQVLLRDQAAQARERRVVEPAAVGLGYRPRVHAHRVPVLVVQGPIPVGEGDRRVDVLEPLLELVQVDPVPGEELFPTVLAEVAVDAGPVAEAAFILEEAVIPMHLADRVAEPLQLVGGHGDDILSRLDLTDLFAELIDRPGRLGVLGLAPGQGRGSGGVRRRGLDGDVVSRAAVVDPGGDEGDLVFGHRLPPPGEPGELPPVERREPTQALDQARSGGPAPKTGTAAATAGEGAPTLPRPPIVTTTAGAGADAGDAGDDGVAAFGRSGPGAIIRTP